MITFQTSASYLLSHLPRFKRILKGPYGNRKHNNLRAELLQLRAKISTIDAVMDTLTLQAVNDMESYSLNLTGQWRKEPWARDTPNITNCYLPVEQFMGTLAMDICKHKSLRFEVTEEECRISFYELGTDTPLTTIPIVRIPCVKTSEWKPLYEKRLKRHVLFPLPQADVLRLIQFQTSKNTPPHYRDQLGLNLIRLEAVYTDGAWIRVTPIESHYVPNKTLSTRYPLIGVELTPSLRGLPHTLAPHLWSLSVEKALYKDSAIPYNTHLVMHIEGEDFRYSQRLPSTIYPDYTKIPPYLYSDTPWFELTEDAVEWVQTRIQQTLTRYAPKVRNSALFTGAVSFRQKGTTKTLEIGFPNPVDPKLAGYEPLLGGTCQANFEFIVSLNLVRLHTMLKNGCRKFGTDSAMNPVVSLDPILKGTYTICMPMQTEAP